MVMTVYNNSIATKFQTKNIIKSTIVVKDKVGKTKGQEQFLVRYGNPQKEDLYMIWW